MIKVTVKDGESAERLLRRFATYVKSRKLLRKFRGARYFKQKATKRETRRAAVKREEYRTAAKKKQFLG